MEFQVLGPVGLRRDGQAVTRPGRLQRTLLAVLLARGGQPVSVDGLTDAMWRDAPDSHTGQRLHLHIHRLRRMLGDPDRLVFGPEGYRLRFRPGELDAERFEALIGKGVNIADADPEHAVESLRGALDLWQGAPLADVADAPVLDNWAHRLNECRLTALETLYRAELVLGQDATIIGELTELVRAHPLRERLHGLLITAFYRAGRAADALAAYRTARKAMIEELGIEPGPELRELERSVLAEAPVAPNGPSRPTDTVPAQLPANVPGFVGRESELAALDALSTTETPVLITAVAGGPGVGKTALVVHWAHRARHRFPDGQLYVDLHGYGPDQPVPPGEALSGFLRALGLDDGAIPENLDERAARFRTLVDQRRMLVVLDNAQSPEQVRPLLPGSQTCVTLVTSRDALAGLTAREGARCLELDRLPHGDAYRLMTDLLGDDRATADPAATDGLIERCARLPLALRVGAELIRSHPGRSVTALAEELAGQEDTLDVLHIDGDPHTAVRDIFSWSYQRLDPAVARVFRLTGVHPGHDMDAYAVAALAGANPRETRRMLEVLTCAHLLDATADGRYRPHDLLRAYAAELAAVTEGPDERAAALSRLLSHYLATASAAMEVVAPQEAAIRPKAPAWDGEIPPFATHEQSWRWLDAERANLMEAALHGGPRYTTLMSGTLRRYLGIGAYIDEAVTLHTRSVQAAQELDDTLAEADARRVLGSALNGRGGDDQAAWISSNGRLQDTGGSGTGRCRPLR